MNYKNLETFGLPPEEKKAYTEVSMMAKKKIFRAITSLHKECDLTDIGNEIGLIIAECNDIHPDSMDMFQSGFEHGIDLYNHRKEQHKQ